MRFLNPIKLYKSNYGRNFGWYIEYKGQRVGELINVRHEDQFWHSYDLISLDKETDKILFNPENWDYSNFEFRNKVLSLYAKNALCSGESPDFTENRIFMRGLYVGPNIVEESIILCFEFIEFTVDEIRNGLSKLIGRNR
ncbi:MAG: hypothetical protein AAGD28_29455 [Bacteroidota bacterium]